MHPVIPKPLDTLGGCIRSADPAERDETADGGIAAIDDEIDGDLVAAAGKCLQELRRRVDGRGDIRKGLFQAVAPRAELFDLQLEFSRKEALLVEGEGAGKCHHLAVADVGDDAAQVAGGAIEAVPVTAVDQAGLAGDGQIDARREFREDLRPVLDRRVGVLHGNRTVEISTVLAQMDFGASGIEAHGLAGVGGDGHRLQTLDDGRAAVDALQPRRKARLQVRPLGRDRKAVAGADFCRQIEFPDDIAGRIDLCCRAQRAEGGGDAVDIVVDVDLGAEQADTEGIAAEFDIGAFAADACLVARRDCFQHCVLQRRGRIEPAAGIKRNHQEDASTQQPEFLTAAGLPLPDWLDAAMMFSNGESQM